MPTLADALPLGEPETPEFPSAPAVAPPPASASSDRRKANANQCEGRRMKGKRSSRSDVGKRLSACRIVSREPRRCLPSSDPPELVPLALL